MKIIKELASSSVNADKKDSFSVRISIFLAVVLLGIVIFIQSSLRQNEFKQILSTSGDYQVSISGIDKNLYDKLKKNENIEKISWNRAIKDWNNGFLYEKDRYFWELEGVKASKGRLPKTDSEILVPIRFLKQHSELGIGSNLKIGEKNYLITGTYDDHSFSFEENIFLALSNHKDKTSLFKENGTVEALIWYKKPRDTYTNTKALLKELNINEDEALKTGRLYYNKEYLDYKMIYPKGIIPPKKELEKALENYGLSFILVILFAVMIYGAFNVWNNRDMKEIALLKSVGMTKNQIRKMVKKKAINLSLIPITFGTLVSYFSANLLLYLMWLNNSKTYNNLSKIFGESYRATSFQWVKPTFPAIFSIIILSFITTILAAAIPASKSGKLNILEGLKGLSKSEKKKGKSKLKGSAEKSLALDYFYSYHSTYKVITLTMVLSALVITFVLVSQAYRGVKEDYDSFKSPYNFTSNIYTEDALPNDFKRDIKEIDSKEIHLFETEDFGFPLAENKNNLSKEFLKALNSGDKSKNKIFVSVIGLSNNDYYNLTKKSNIKENEKFIFLNKISKDGSPYNLREYIPVINSNAREFTIKNGEETNGISIKFSSVINEMPYKLTGIDQNGIYIFTTEEELNSLIKQYGKTNSDFSRHYTLKAVLNEKDNSMDHMENIILSYIPKSDHSTSTSLLEKAADTEQKRNEDLLNTGIQILLLIIALSNAYNSFHGNIRSRKREFQVLCTIGMTKKQINKMIKNEGLILLFRTIIAYILVFIAVVSIRAIRSPYEFILAVTEILKRINYLPIILVFLIMGIGIFIAVKSSFKSIFKEDINSALREI